MIVSGAGSPLETRPMPVAIRPVLVLDYTMTALITENVDYIATRPVVIIDSHNVCIAADAGSTSGVQRQALGAGGFTPVHTAIVCAVAGAVTRVTAGFVSTQYVVAATDVVRCLFTAVNSTLNARHWATITPTAVAGGA
jgi:hypothetical protein